MAKPLLALIFLIVTLILFASIFDASATLLLFSYPLSLSQIIVTSNATPVGCVPATGRWPDNNTRIPYGAEPGGGAINILDPKHNNIVSLAVNNLTNKTISATVIFVDKDINGYTESINIVNETIIPAFANRTANFYWNPITRGNHTMDVFAVSGLDINNDSLSVLSDKETETIPVC